MISVITSTYNRSKSLLKAIKSVQKQTFEDWELIIVDDFSQDDTEQVVKSIKDDRIKYIRLGKNVGNDTCPKNKGILASKGEYIAFLDDDNTWRPDHLQALFNIIEREDVDGVYGDRYLHSTDGTSGIGIHAEFDPMLIMAKNYIDTSDILLKRDVLFDLGGFDESFKKYIDWNLWVRLVKANKRLKRVPLILTDYYLREDSKSHRDEDTTNNI